MNKTINTIITVLLLAISTTAIAGGGWPQKKGSGYVKLSEWWIISNQHYTDNGLIDPNVTTGIFNTSIYFEYGITNKLTATAYVPFYSRAYNNNLVSATTGEILVPGEAINSVGDTDLGLTYGLTSGTVNTTASIIFGLPLGIDDGGTQENLQTGDGEFNQMLKIDAGAGYKLLGRNAYATVYVGYNNRTNGYSDEVRFGLETGVSFFDDKLLALIRVFGVESTNNGAGSVGANSTSIFANNSEHISYSPELNYSFSKNWGLSVGMAGAFSGKLIFASPSYSVGVFAKF